MSLTAAEINAGLDHPVIDSDAHWLEFGPYVKQRREEIGGEKVAARFTGLGPINECKRWGLWSALASASAIPGSGCCR